MECWGNEVFLKQRGKTQLNLSNKATHLGNTVWEVWKKHRPSYREPSAPEAAIFSLKSVYSAIQVSLGTA